MTAEAFKASKAGAVPRPDLPSILFVDKVFLKARSGVPLRGVELFNLKLLSDLIALGYSVEVLAVRKWRNILETEMGAVGLRFVDVPDTRIDVLNLWVGTLCARSGRCDVLLLGNVGRGLTPMLRVLRRQRKVGRAVLIAHREATPGFVRLFSGLPGHVLAVNGLIAQPFRNAGHPSVHIDYGVTDADLFTPVDTGGEAPDAFVDFCVLGMLDNAWKGADTAVDAFRMLPGPVRARCRLHLASYTRPPAFDEPGIKAYPWLAPGEVPGFLRGMDVMLVPSRDEGVMRETFSQAIVQGMLIGLPVLVSDLPVLKEKVDRGGGFVCATARDLANGMEQLATDAQRQHQLGQEARETALQRYVWDTRRFASRYLGPGGF